MSRQHPNLVKIELIAEVLGALREQLVFVSGCAVDLLLTEYHALEKQFALLGFKRDMAQPAAFCLRRTTMW